MEHFLEVNYCTVHTLLHYNQNGNLSRKYSIKAPVQYKHSIYMSWKRSAYNEVNNWAQSLHSNILRRLFATYLVYTSYLDIVTQVV